MTEEHKNKIGRANAITHLGLKQTKEHIAKRTAYIIGNKWNVGKKQSKELIAKRVLKIMGRKNTPETLSKMRNSALGKKCPWAKKNLPKVKYGKDHWNWKGGITTENHKLRTSLQFRHWREGVFARDNWTCQKCFVRGGKLHAHHIKKFSEFPELRFDQSNGMTLCKPCHKATHRKSQQFMALK